MCIDSRDLLGARAADAGIRAVVTGLWLGVLTPNMLRRLDHWYYTRGFPMYQDADYNRSGWRRSELQTSEARDCSCFGFTHIKERQHFSQRQQVRHAPG
jgi:hypothetical protein